MYVPYVHQFDVYPYASFLCYIGTAYHLPVAATGKQAKEIPQLGLDTVCSSPSNNFWVVLFFCLDCGMLVYL